MLACAALPASAQELTIFWAEWDPANYLQELVNEYTAETGVTVTVQTTPWSDFQTKTFAELNAHGDAYDMVVGDSQWLGAGSTGGHYVDLTAVLRGAQPRRGLRAGHGQVLLRVRRQELGGSGRGRRQRLGLPQGLVRGSRPRWPPSRRSTATTSACRRTTSSCATSPSSSTGPTRTATASRSTPRPPTTRWRWGSSRRIFTYGGDLGDYAAGKAEGIINSPENVEALELYRELYQFTPPNWGQAFFLENNQAYHRGPGGDER